MISQYKVARLRLYFGCQNNRFQPDNSQMFWLLYFWEVTLYWKFPCRISSSMSFCLRSFAVNITVAIPDPLTLHILYLGVKGLKVSITVLKQRRYGSSQSLKATSILILEKFWQRLYLTVKSLNLWMSRMSYFVVESLNDQIFFPNKKWIDCCHY